MGEPCKKGNFGTIGVIDWEGKEILDLVSWDKYQNILYDSLLWEKPLTVEAKKKNIPNSIKRPEVYNGERVWHARYKYGTILSHTEESITILFEDGNSRLLNRKFCLRNNLLEAV